MLRPPGCRQATQRTTMSVGAALGVDQPRIQGLRMTTPKLVLSALTGAVIAAPSAPAPLASDACPVGSRTVQVDGLQLLYREAGDPGNPTILLLHGFPSSSSMFRDLIPRLSDHFHLVAPDYPGSGNS